MDYSQIIIKQEEEIEESGEERADSGVGGAIVGVKSEEIDESVEERADSGVGGGVVGVKSEEIDGERDQHQPNHLFGAHLYQFGFPPRVKEEVSGNSCLDKIPIVICERLVLPRQDNSATHSLPTEEQLESHLASHTVKEDKPFKCNMCEYSTKWKRHLKSHIRVHTGERPFTCNLCGYASVNDSNLKRHLLTHMAEKPHRCNICEYSANRKSWLIVHKKRKHRIGKMKEFLCEICDYRTFIKEGLTSHMKTHGVGDEKRYGCDVCGYTTRYRTTFETHIRRHKEYKPYKCDVCTYSSVESGTLKKHKMRKHQIGEMREIICGRCNYKTFIKADIARHMKRRHKV